MLLFTLGATGATLLVVLGLLSIPAIDACKGDSRGLVGCMRQLIDQRFDLPVGMPAAPAQQAGEDIAPPQVAEIPEAEALAEEPEVDAATTAAVVLEPADQPVPPAAPAELAGADLPPGSAPVIVADLPAAEVVPEITRSLGPEPGARAAAIPPAGETDGEAAITTTPPAIPESIPPLPPLEAQDDPVAADDAVAEAAEDSPAVPALSVDTLAAPVLPPALASVLDAVDPRLLLPAAEALAAEPDAAALAARPEPVETPAPVDVAIVDLPPPAAATEVVAPPVLPPTIDAVEIDGEDNFVAGNGPAGALMRLYVDDVLVGESPVEAGRWLVEGVELFTRPSQLLRVDAVEPETGRVLSSTAISFEIELPAPEVEPVPMPEAVVPDTAPAEVAPATPPDPEPAALAEAPLTEGRPALPPLRPVVPRGETASVTILGAPASDALIDLSAARAQQDAAVVTVKPPAVIARFETLAEPDGVAVLRAVPYGDPGAGRFVSGKAIIRRGDTLWDIAHRYYGRGIRYDTIVRANRDLIARPSRIYPGQVFDLPLVYDE